MEAFFTNYRPFEYDPQRTPKAEFDRLCAFRGWTSPKSLQRHTLAFHNALKAENSKRRDPVSLFFAQFDDFDYRSDVLVSLEAVDQKAQFQRLVAHRKWKEGSSRYRKAFRDFEAAVKTAAGRTPASTADNSSSQRVEPVSADAAPAPQSDPSTATSGPDPPPAGAPNEAAVPPEEATPQPDEASAPASGSTPTTAVTPRPRMKPIRASVEVVFRGYEDRFTSSQTPMDQFFAKWPAFNYNPENHMIDEYERMAVDLRWDDKTYNAGYKPFYAATRAEFTWQIFRPRTLTVRRQVMVEVGNDNPAELEAIVDTEEDDKKDLALKAFNRFCLILGRNRGANRRKAENNLAGIHVNIFDLIHHLRMNTVHELHRFPSVRKLAWYSYSNGIVYPWEEAGHSESSKVLRYLLRGIGEFKVPRRGKPGGCRDPDFDRSLR